MLTPIHVLVDLPKTLIDVPEEKHSEAGCGSCLPVFFAFEDPILIVLTVSDQEVFAVTCINKGINISHGEVLFCRVNVCTDLISLVIQVCFVYLVRVLGRECVQIAGQSFEVF